MTHRFEPVVERQVQSMPRQLIQILTVVLLTSGVLLALDSHAATTADPYLAGDHAAVHTEAWASVSDPEIPLPGKCDHTVDAGYHAPQAPCEPHLAPAQPRSTYFARAPPAL